MWFWVEQRRVAVFALLIASVMVAVGCGGASDDGTAGTAGNRGTAGSGGSSENVKVALLKCTLNANTALNVQLWGFPGWRGDGKGLHHVLRYMDGRVPLTAEIQERKAQLPDLADLPPRKTLDEPGPKPRVLWSTFRWRFPWGDDGAERVFLLRIYQGLDEDLYGREGEPDSRLFSLERGFYQNTVALVDWQILQGEESDEDKPVIGAGTLTVIGLDVPGAATNSVRVSIIRFPECEPPPPPPDTFVDPPFVCREPDPLKGDNPWFHEDVDCSFEFTSVGFHVDLIHGLEPFAVIIGFRAQLEDVAIENGSFIPGPDGKASFTGTYEGEPASFELAPNNKEVIVRFTGDADQYCTYDTEHGELSDCGPTAP